MNKVVTRIAPSPTGLFHIGTARSALYNYLYAKKHGGEFVVRIEDTDKVRSEKKYEDDILEGLSWLGIEYDRLERQSERTGIYTEKLKDMVERDVAYVSREPAKDDPEKEVEIIRLRNPGKKVTFSDEVRGEVTFDTTELGDFVIARSMTDPLYHLAVVIDDADMGITHVIRGEDHISNTPRQILIQEALGIERPVYAHIPLILASDRSKLSKRKGAVSVTKYREMGFLSVVIDNYIALLGWNPGTEQEIFSLADLIDNFSLEQIHKGGAVFDMEKLKWVQKEHRKLQDRDDIRSEITESLVGHEGILDALSRSEKVLDDILERYALRADLVQAVEEGEYSFYEERPECTTEGLTWKKDSDPATVPDRLAKLHELLSDVDEENFVYDVVKEAVWDYADEVGKGDVLWPMRVALSGKDRSPDPILLAEALGKEETLVRIKNAQALY